MSNNKKIIVLGATHGGLAVIRTFRKRGFDVLVLTYNDQESGLKSRYVDKWQTCPHPKDEDAFVKTLLSFVSDWQGAMIFCTNDYFATVVSRNKAQLSEHYTIDVADWEHTRIFLEKDLTYQLADRTGVAHPRFIQPQSMEELEQHIPDLQFPIMIKPVHSHQFVNIFGEKLLINDTVDELRANFQKIVDAKQSVVVCEIIPGSDYKTLETVQTYTNSDGTLAVAFCCIKLRQTPPMYGVIRVGKSMPEKQDLVEAGLKLLREIDYRGYASIEFKRDPRDNVLKLIEVNIRSLRMTQLPIASGVDFPWMAYSDKVENKPIVLDTYNENMNYIELFADFADYIRHDSDKSPVRLFEPYFARHKTFPYLSLSDPMPFISEITRRFGRLVTKIRN